MDKDQVLIEATKRYHTDAEFRAAIEYAVMHTLSYKVLPLSEPDIQDFKERLRITAANAIILYEDLKKDAL